MRRLHLHTYNFSLVLTGAAILTLAVTVLAQTAISHIKIEAEQGTFVGGVSSAQDASASGGSMISFLAEVTPPPTSSSVFTETFSNLSHWTLGNWTTGQPGNSDTRSKATIVNGRAFIENFDQNYGDATLRSDRMYDVRNGGTFSFDVSLNDGMLPATGAFIGFPDVAFIDQPLNAPSYYDDNGKGTGPRNGGYYQFWHSCSIPWQAGHARQFIDWTETVMPGEDLCLGQVTITAGQVNRVELRYNGNNGWELWVSNAGTTSPLIKLRAFTMQIPEIGYFLIGSHNHASLKYSNNTLVSANATFDNITYPAAAGYTSSFRNGANVTKGAAQTAQVVFNACAIVSTGPFSMTLNGTDYPFTPIFKPLDPHSHCFPHAISVPLTAVTDGANSITFQGVTNPANIDIVLTRDTP